MKIKKGDKVQVLLGKDRGKTGKVEKVMPKKRQVLVSGVNMFVKHVKSKGEGKPGGIVQITKPLSVGKVALICPKCGQRTRVGYLKDSKGVKMRVCRKCGEKI